MFREHVVMDSSDGHLRAFPESALGAAAQGQAATRAVHNTLQAYKDIVCLIKSGRPVEQLCTPDSQWLQKKCAAPLNNPAPVIRYPQCGTVNGDLCQQKVSKPGLSSSNDIPVRSPSVTPPHSSSQQVGRSYLREQSVSSYDGGTEEEDEYVPKGRTSTVDRSWCVQSNILYFCSWDYTQGHLEQKWTGQNNSALYSLVLSNDVIVRSTLVTTRAILYSFNSKPVSDTCVHV